MNKNGLVRFRIPSVFRKDWFQVLTLCLLVPAIYYPVFWAEYIYTDETVQLWYYRPGSGYSMFTEQGRYLTDRLFSFLFGRAETISDLRYIRIFSLSGWILAVPVWYFILKHVIRRERLPVLIVPLLITALICAPTTSISIGWASCSELFISYTSGLISGYLLYRAVFYKSENAAGSFLLVLGSLLAGLLALFTYQNGFGCFLLPFFMHAVANPGRFRKLIPGFAAFGLIALIYYGLFHWQLNSLGIPPGSRTQVVSNLVKKLGFFIARPLAGSFRLNYLFNETSKSGLLVSIPIALITAIGYVRLLPALVEQSRKPGFGFAVRSLAILFLFFLAVYAPSLAVRENFASNRTMLALVLTSSSWIFITLVLTLKKTVYRNALVLCLILVMSGIAVFNYNFQFRKPVELEYLQIRAQVESKWQSGISQVLFFAPGEESFVDRYGITRSWDEFGVPSGFFAWVPEPLVRQLILEQTGSRETAMSVNVQLIPYPWPGFRPMETTQAVSGDSLFVFAAP